MPLWVLDTDPALWPPASTALDEPNGLLAVGGDLSCERLRQSYRHGVFPWYSPGEPLLWWSPDPRGVFVLDGRRPSASLRRQLRRDRLRLSCNRAFTSVIRACAEPRDNSPGCWIGDDMIHAYEQLHRAGDAHSIEVWDAQGQLVGGLYGVAAGLLFCAESMFSRISNGSKLALALLRQLLWQQGAELFDCQLLNPHLQRLGAQAISRDYYLQRLAQLSPRPSPWPQWQGRDLTEVLLHD